MQYVRSISGSVSKTWNSINPATLSGAIDVIVVEQEDGTLACSPFHVRFGKFSLLRPSEKKVEFRVNDVKQEFAMKLGEGGEAFFVFETTDSIPEFMQTSPLVSPTSSPSIPTGASCTINLSEPDFLELDTTDGKHTSGTLSRPGTATVSARDIIGRPQILSYSKSLSASPEFLNERLHSRSWTDGGSLHTYSEKSLPLPTKSDRSTENNSNGSQTRLLNPSLPEEDGPYQEDADRSQSRNSTQSREAIDRALVLSQRLSASNIPTQVTSTGDLMLDMTGYKSSEDDALRAEVIARKILSDELEGTYDIGALIGADEHGKLWIYSSEEAKEAANNGTNLAEVSRHIVRDSYPKSDLGYHSEEEVEIPSPKVNIHRREDFGIGLETPPKTPPERVGDHNRNYAKTLRLTSEQLKSLGLKSGPNPVSFTVNRATCQANMYLWRYDVPIVISDIDGTITKSDALGHVLNMIGRDWTHIGVAKLYTEIVNNGYNIMYLTSRSVGQADTTRAYLNGVVQESYRLPKGPTIMSPDRTIAALRRELYIRKPEVFKMACLRDIKSLFGQNCTPFYAGFGNRFTDALSYRSVSIPSNRIFTINSYAEVSLDLLSLNKLRYSYVNMREVVDHYFPPVNMLVKSGGEEYTDFTYWRVPIHDIEEFSDSENEEEYIDEDVEDEDECDSFISRDFMDESNMDFDLHVRRSRIGSIEEDENDETTSNTAENNEHVHNPQVQFDAS
ncbi:Nuclear elongation and deformation protein 1 [Golovinomyces cichoracearum]|uniref:Nuclear elongation and deformation protein 1 n=1 Tax=Golovinomyces cichoracearum TaxID=62708 RepID=A0A420ITX4_9PEZI|nr:Nuclear elongation and deformation protein 1 [Golovinomyces cichoracearum]